MKKIFAILCLATFSFGTVAVAASAFNANVETVSVDKDKDKDKDKKHSKDKIEIIYKDLDLSVLDFEEFLKLYHHATEEPYSFLFVNVRTEELRKSLNAKYNINSEK
jgi:hypothetical protein